MKHKTSEPKPLAILQHSKTVKTEIYVLDEGDLMSMNSSTNYDHKYKGPSIITKDSNSKNEYKNEYYVNDPHIWYWIESLMRLGIKYLDEHPDFNSLKFQQKIRNEYDDRKPYISMHK